jgi:hypothetical protein
MPESEFLFRCYSDPTLATRRRAEGATLQELADSYDRSISTMRRATRAI